MKGGHSLIFLLAVSAAYPQTVPTTERPTESQHRCGPDGLEGWTLNYTIPDRPGQQYPEVLVLARRGRIIRRITGSPFVWNWIFWAGGQQIAYETGPLHFGMLCTLADIPTGRELANYDCFHGLPASAPEWEKALQAGQ
jgi:hypothetical protein